MKLVFVLLGLVSFATGVLALEPGDECDQIKVMPKGMICWENTAHDCKNGNLRRIESLMCAVDEFRQEDKVLNATYRKALKSLDVPSDGTIYSDPPARKKELIESQRAWVSFRVTDCLAKGYLNGSDWNDVFVTACETKLTKERTKVLIERYLE